jgi:hypothetical protein
VFDQLTFASPKEKEEFEKYKRLKGVYLHKQVYDILLEANGGGEVTYYELSSLIRYDKNLRDMLYKYLAMAEEYLRALLCDKYDVSKGNAIFKGHCYNSLNQELVEKDDSNSHTSYLYFLLEPDFADLMRICIEKNLITLSGTEKKQIKELRNKTMHHSLLLLGKAASLSDLYSYFEAFEEKINALMQILPEKYRAGFVTSIKTINGYPGKQYLTKFYLEIQNGKVCIKK